MFACINMVSIASRHMVSDHQFQLFLVNCVYFETTSFGKNCTKKYVLTLITLIVFI